MRHKLSCEEGELTVEKMELVYEVEIPAEEHDWLILI